jgi:hypothetical protein
MIFDKRQKREFLPIMHVYLALESQSQPYSNFSLANIERSNKYDKRQKE